MCVPAIAFSSGTHVNPRNSGFTLFELMITMIVLSVLAAMAVPAFGNFLARQRVAAARSEMQVMLMLARSEALDRGLRIGLCPSADGHTCRTDSRWEQGYLLFEDRDYNRTRGASETILRQGQLTPRVQIRTSSGRKVVIFHPDGSAAGFNMTMSLCGHGLRAPARQLVLSNAGRLRAAEGPLCTI